MALRRAVYRKQTTVYEGPMTRLMKRAEKSGGQFSWREFTIAETRPSGRVPVKTGDTAPSLTVGFLPISRRPVQIVNVPVDAFIAHLGMLAQELIRQCQGAGIVLQISEDFRLAFGILGAANLTIN